MMILGITPLVVPGDVVTPAIVAILVAAATSLTGAWFARPKTRAEADNLNAAASVSMSAEAREWTKLFVDRANAAEARADAAELRADVAERKAEQAADHADEIEAGLVACYGYVRELQNEIRRVGGHVIAAPVALEALWRQQHP